jgi:hypothetical protein
MRAVVNAAPMPTLVHSPLYQKLPAIMARQVM